METGRQPDGNPWSRMRSKNLSSYRRIYVMHNNLASAVPYTDAGSRKRRTGRRLTYNIGIIVEFHCHGEPIVTPYATSNAALGRARSCTLVQQGLRCGFDVPGRCVRYRSGRYEEELEAAFSVLTKPPKRKNTIISLTIVARAEAGIIVEGFDFVERVAAACDVQAGAEHLAVALGSNSVEVGRRVG